MTKPKPKPKKEVPPELLAAFRTMCQHYKWSQVEMLTYLLEYAIEQNTNLALPLHVWRVNKANGVKWVNPYTEE